MLSSLRSLLLIASLSTAAAAQADGLYVEGGTLARRYDLSVPGATSGDSAARRSRSASIESGYARARVSPPAWRTKSITRWRGFFRTCR